MPTKPRIPYLIAEIARKQNPIMAAQTAAVLEALLANFEGDQERVAKLLADVLKSSALLEKVNNLIVSGNLHEAENVLRRGLSADKELSKLLVGVDLCLPKTKG